MSSPLLNHNYTGLSEPTSKTTPATTTMAEKPDQKQSSSPPTVERSGLQVDLNMKATELRLGPPGSESPERDPLPPADNDGKGAKRGFSREKNFQNNNSSSAAAAVHASKAQVVGWPPIRSFRKNNMNPPHKPQDKPDDAGCLYVKVSMDGAPYLRKVDLNTYGSYAHLSAALKKMFSCFSIGESGLLKDHQSSDKCILTYEDKDGDWMLVGDVPWDMFINTCRKLRITKATEPIASAPRALQKCNFDAE